AKGIVRGRIGRAMLTVRDNELVAETMGIRSSWLKVLAFGFAALYAGVGGGLFALILGVVTSDSFPLLLSVGFLAAVVVGGEATVVGAVFGALFVQFVPYYASDINPGLAPVIYGLSLIVFMLLTSGGVMGAGLWLFDRLRAHEREHALRGGPNREPMDPAVEPSARIHDTRRALRGETAVATAPVTTKSTTSTT
ncbi:MAG: branched-chain amino acid ABC transporter permease, partial [Aeromicrobium sp.]